MGFDPSDAMILLAKGEDIRGHHIFKGDLFDERWVKDVDGAKLLERLFQMLSGNTFQFRKTLHTPILLSNVGKSGLEELLTLLDERRTFAQTA